MNYSFPSILAQAAETSGAATEQASQSPFGNSIIMIVVMVVLFWVILIRPQNKARKEQKERMESMRKGDKVVTNAGIHGTIVYVDDNTVNVQVADGVTIKFEKMAIAHVTKKEAELPQG